jgi:hypothetical protein
LRRSASALATLAWDEEEGSAFEMNQTRKCETRKENEEEKNRRRLEKTWAFRSSCRPYLEKEAGSRTHARFSQAAAAEAYMTRRDPRRDLLYTRDGG